MDGSVMTLTAEDFGTLPAGDPYLEFLARKAVSAPDLGFAIDDAEINSILKPHQKDIVRWAVAGGRRAIFAAYGLGKSVIQLETLRLILSRVGGMGLIVLPLGVRQEFVRDGRMLGMEVRFIRRIEEATEPGRIYLANYETVRDGKLDPHAFTAVSLDEAACLRGMGSTKTFREFMALLAGDRKTMDARTRSAEIKYRFVATATPSPNNYIELLAYSAFLGILDVGGAKTRFFKRDPVHADALTLHAHKEKEFWQWLNSWAIFLQKPGDIGHSNEGYELPPMRVFWHEVASDLTSTFIERNGQGRLLRDANLGVSDQAREKRACLGARVEKMAELVNATPEDHWLLWHDLEDERKAIEKAVPGVTSVYGKQTDDAKEAAIIGFSEGHIRRLAAKPCMLGAGANFQRHCHKAIFLGVGFKAYEFMQAIHRVYRFLQDQEVEIHIIHSEGERSVVQKLREKWEQHDELTERMSDLIRQHGLNRLPLDGLKRSTSCERREARGTNFHVVNNDTVLETRLMPSESVHLILTSIPFSTQYEYTPSYLDFGHTDTNEHFWQQMGFLIPELYRVLHPGRICAIHVKDRIVPGGLTGVGFQTVYPFHVDAIREFQKYGFAYLGMKTIVTDVVRENNQTYRLGWSEQCKDGSRMGVGMPEYLLLFRKPPSDAASGYADTPVLKSKEDYTRSRWQIDAHGYARSNGNRPLRPEDLAGLKHDEIFRLFRKHSLMNVYDFEEHVALGEHLEARKALPVTFMLLQPQSWHPDVWTDITRMRTLNGAQSAAGRESHLCPLQFDLADRAITQYTMPGEVVYDPFGGLMTVPYCAVKLGRFGRATELNPGYFDDGVFYLRQAEEEKKQLTLFDLLDAEEPAEAVR